MNEQNNLNETVESAQQPVYEQQPVQPPVYEQPVYQQQYQQPVYTQQQYTQQPAQPQYQQPVYVQPPVQQQYAQQPVYVQQPVYTAQVDDSRKLGITAMILGILSLCTCWTVVAGFVLAIIGMKKSGSAKERAVTFGFTTAFARVGRITSIVGLIASICMIFYWIVIIIAAAFAY
ncbi:MAG: hypothetical protein E7444_06040 [Ruminococcaceae bacterium]|nr:hypothetical protein [Oscillospiraceae bacterium]